MSGYDAAQRLGIWLAILGGLTVGVAWGFWLHWLVWVVGAGLVVLGFSLLERRRG